MRASRRDDADEDLAREREEILESINFFDEADDDDEDDLPGRRTPETFDSFNLVEDEDEPNVDEVVTTPAPEVHLLVHHHGVRANALHMKTIVV